MMHNRVFGMGMLSQFFNVCIAKAENVLAPCSFRKMGATYAVYSYLRFVVNGFLEESERILRLPLDPSAMQTPGPKFRI